MMLTESVAQIVVPTENALVVVRIKEENAVKMMIVAMECNVSTTNALIIAQNKIKSVDQLPIAVLDSNAIQILGVAQKKIVMKMK